MIDPFSGKFQLLTSLKIVMTIFIYFYVSMMIEMYLEKSNHILCETPQFGFSQ